MRTRRPASDADLGFFAELRQQRWDDHRLYHHSRINQSLHLVSAFSFLISYVLLVFEPGIAAMVGWIFAMCSRQTGHFFFEPDDYDEINHATHEHKEAIKVGYNLQRKVILLTIWAATPVLLLILWLGLGIAGLVVRTVQLFFIRSVQTGLVWTTKILTDPFHDVKLYLRSPLYLLRGELIDPMEDVRAAFEAEAELERAFEDSLEEPVAENNLG